MLLARCGDSVPLTNVYPPSPSNMPFDGFFNNFMRSLQGKTSYNFVLQMVNGDWSKKNQTILLIL